jgi:hypothetical protein
MLEQATKVKCPLCEGHGELLPSAIVETFSTPELRKRLDARIAEIAEISGCAPVTANGKVHDFQKDVHTWNPALPIWRRSPKE